MLSIVIATKNRSDFLKRLLTYYWQSGYKYWLCIGDSSDASHLEVTKATLKSFEGKLKIKYYQYPGLSVAACHQKLLPYIETPYTACITDGGFLVIGALEKCVRFLEANPQYGIAHGLGAVFELRSDGPYGEFLSLGKYDRLPKIEGDTACQRLRSYLDDYSVTIYCVYRSQVWKEIWQYSDSMPDQTFAGEVLPGCLSVMQTKAKELDCLYLIRQIHRRRYLMPLAFDWVTSPNWGLSYQKFRQTLVKSLVKMDSVSEADVEQIIKKGFWGHLNRCLVTKFQATYGRQSAAKNLLKHLVNKILPFRPKISLRSLLDKSSPYHNDFMPVYNLVREGGK